MTFDNIRLEKKDHIALITFDHPPANTWNLAALTDFEKAVAEVENDPDVRVVILTGAGEKCFSAGYDVTDAANADKISPKARGLWERIDRFSKPVIAAINGHTRSGDGLELAMACHFRIMADVPRVKVGLTELNLGIIPGWGGSQRLPRLVGRAKALDMILFSKTFGRRPSIGDGAGQSGVHSRDLAGRCLCSGEKNWLKRPPIAVSCVLKAMSAGEYEGLQRGLQVEDEGSARVRETKDRIEGFKAFLEKRKPLFTGE